MEGTMSIYPHLISNNLLFKNVLHTASKNGFTHESKNYESNSIHILLQNKV
jgi:hypothetical protein